MKLHKLFKGRAVATVPTPADQLASDVNDVDVQALLDALRIDDAKVLLEIFRPLVSYNVTVAIYDEVRGSLVLEVSGHRLVVATPDADAAMRICAMVRLEHTEMVLVTAAPVPKMYFASQSWNCQLIPDRVLVS